MKITYYGHACLGIQVDNIHIVVDPFISGNPLQAAKAIDLEKIKADYILITHAHEDHVLDVLTLAEINPNAVIVSNAEIAGYYGAKGLKTHPMNHGGAWEFDFGKLQYTSAVHSSSFADGTYGGEPGGFILTHNQKSIYIAGDTALSMDMKLIPMFTKLDLAILPIGDNFTMGIDQGVVAADFLQCDKILGYHYDTFGFIVIDHQKAKQAFLDRAKELILLPIGDSLSV
ncbi:metal-dependent hydrolase [Myroides sp. LJL115]